RTPGCWAPPCSRAPRPGRRRAGPRPADAAAALRPKVCCEASIRAGRPRPSGTVAAAMNPLTDALRLPAVLRRYRELLSAFVRRELRARVEGSVLGRVWPVLQPALLFAIYYFIFVKILRIGFTDQLAPHGDAGKGWRSTFYLITGILPWTALAE